jgi:hypothetical protein
VITISTADLLGLIGDVASFTSPDKDHILSGINLRWDGEILDAVAGDGRHIGLSRWDPDKPSTPIEEDLLNTATDSADDEPWEATISGADAKDALKIFKLPTKEMGTPLTLHVTGRYVHISRSALTGHSAITHEMRRVETLDEPFPDLRGTLAALPEPAPAKALAFPAAALADFASVRTDGPMRLDFTGPDSVVRVKIGARFDGAILPERLEPVRIAA